MNIEKTLLFSVSITEIVQAINYRLKKGYQHTEIPIKEDFNDKLLILNDLF